MTTAIQISKEAVEHLALRAGMGLDEAEELMSELFSMCVIESRPGGGVEELVRAVQEFLKGREELKKMDPPIIFMASPVIDEMQRALNKLTVGDASKPSDVGK